MMQGFVNQNCEAVIGMSLLYGFKFQVEVLEGGTVTIEALK